MHVHRVVARLGLRFPALRTMIYRRPLCAIVKKSYVCSARAQAGRELTRESEVKDTTINGSERPVGDSEYIVRRKRWIPADSAAGSHTASDETGRRPHRHHQHHRTGGSDPLDTMKPRIQCVLAL